MSIFQKIKESITRPFKKNNSNRDSFAAFLEVSDIARKLEKESEQEKTTPLKYGLDLSEKRDVNFHGVYFDNVAYQRTQEMIKKSESKRLIKAKHIYNQTKNKRIKMKQLKIIASEELRREVQ